MFHGVIGEFLASLLVDGSLEEFHELLQLVDVHLVVQLDVTLAFHVHDDCFKGVDVIFVDGFHAEHHVTIHLHEATIAVIGKPLVASLAGKSFYYLVIESQIEDGVHHARHGSAGT